MKADNTRPIWTQITPVLQLGRKTPGILWLLSADLFAAHLSGAKRCLALLVDLRLVGCAV